MFKDYVDYMFGPNAPVWDTDRDKNQSLVLISYMGSSGDLSHLHRYYEQCRNVAKNNCHDQARTLNVWMKDFLWPWFNGYLHLLKSQGVNIYELHKYTTKGDCPIQNAILAKYGGNGVDELHCTMTFSAITQDLEDINNYMQSIDFDAVHLKVGRYSFNLHQAIQVLRECGWTPNSAAVYSAVRENMLENIRILEEIRSDLSMAP